MIAIIDTNFLPRYFIDSQTVGEESKTIFEDKSNFLIIPSIVLVELKYAIAKGRFPQESLAQTLKLVAKGNCMLCPLDEKLIDYIPLELDIHDGIIFATAAIQKKNFDDIVCILTKDKKIKELKQDLIKVIW